MTRRAAGLAIVCLCMIFALEGFEGGVVFPDARSTMTFGFLLLAAYLSGHLVSGLRLPRLTGYIAAGVLFGPHLLGLVSLEMTRELKLLDHLALAFIALAAGGELRVRELGPRLRCIAWTIFFQTLLVLVAVMLCVWAAKPLLPFLEGKPVSHLAAAAALLGVISVARSPSSAIAIISECRARGPFTEMVLGATVAADVLVILLFAGTVSFSGLLLNPGAAVDAGFLGMILLELAVSILTGILLGKGIALYIRRIGAELAVFLLGLAFMVDFFSKHLALYLLNFYEIDFLLEPMLICLTAGFWVQNFSPGGPLFLEKINRSSLPVYVLFFSLTGASLNLRALESTWLMAVILVSVRGFAIWAGSYAGSWISKDPASFRKMSGLSFLTQAGVSLGLAQIVNNRFPGWGPMLATTMVAMITINQVLGPITFKLALNRVGEAKGAAKGGSSLAKE